MDNKKNIERFAAEANQELASVREMSWKSLSRSFNMAGNALIRFHQALEEKRRDAETSEDFESAARISVIVNAMGFYQAALGKQMVERFAARIQACNVSRIAGTKEPSKPRAYHCSDDHWLPVNGGTVGKLDQQKAEIDEFLTSLSAHEHGELVRVCANIYKRAQDMMNSPVTEEISFVMMEMGDRNELDDLCCLLKIATVRLNDEFEKRWPEELS